MKAGRYHCEHKIIQNVSAYTVDVSYSGLYEEGEVEHINCGIAPKFFSSDSFLVVNYIFFF